ncbi:glycosyltransferase [Alistipes sp.]|uniref:glycosyltransferase family 2 protein n=1 Tax=Alistipes sp. TaxID=1872444 RepID=UPI0025BD1D43|nr:glycosyltransferase [Alistipes sp.]
MEPKVSIIIPVYNVEPYLAACLASVTAQTYDDFEAIVVVDGATDGSLLIARSHAERDARISVVATPNQGVARARKEGLDRARGRYVCFLDGDDILEPDMLRELTSAISLNGGYDIVCCNFKRIRSSFEIPVRERHTQDMEGLAFLEATLCHAISATVWARIYRREIFDEELRHYPLHLGEDTLINIQIGCQQPRVHFIDYVGYGYLQRAGSANRSRLDIDYCIRFGEAVAQELARCPQLGPERIEYLLLLSKVRWYVVYLGKSRNPWVGDTEYARWIHVQAKRFRKNLRVYFSRADLLLLCLDRWKWMRPGRLLLATLMRWNKSLRRRMAR